MTLRELSGRLIFGLLYFFCVFLHRLGVASLTVSTLSGLKPLASGRGEPPELNQTNLRMDGRG
jgi:hypothetical protein